MTAFLDIELRRGSDPSAERIHLAAGVPHDGDGVGMIPGGEQGPRAVQKRRPRAGNNYLTITPGIELARAQGSGRDDDDLSLRGFNGRDISHGAKELLWPPTRVTLRRGLFLLWG